MCQLQKQGTAMPTRQINKSLTIECLKFEGDGLTDGQFSGYASVFNNKDAHNDIILPGAYSKALENNERPVAMFFNHDQGDVPVGKWLSIDQDDHGLKVTGELTPGLSKSADILASMRHGTIKGMSVGFSMGKDDYTDNEYGGMNIKSIPLLREISLTPFPANTKAEVTALKSIQNIATIRDAEKALRESGFSKAEAVAFISRLTSLKNSGDPTQEEDELLKCFENFSFIK